MSHYTASNPLYGGDVLALIDAIGVITEKVNININMNIR